MIRIYFLKKYPTLGVIVTFKKTPKIGQNDNFRGNLDFYRPSQA